MILAAFSQAFFFTSIYGIYTLITRPFIGRPSGGNKSQHLRDSFLEHRLTNNQTGELG
jgi:hypothetical protein